MWRLMAIVAILGAGIAGLARADDAAQSSPQQVVEQSADRFAEAFGKRDAAAIAELFTDEAEYIDEAGLVFHGRPVIAAEFAAVFAVAQPGTMSIELISIRPIADGVLVEDGISSFTPEGDGPTSQTRYTATHVRQEDGSWKIASVRELQAGQMTPHDRLQALAWLLGDWHEDVAGNSIASTWEWSEEGNFLISQLSIPQGGATPLTGTHRIGWDAERRQFRSWIFESGGGATEGWWRPNDDGSWSVNLSGVDAAGVRHSSRLTYQTDGNDAIVVSRDQRIVGGESLEGPVHRVVRQPPAVEVSTSQR